MLLYIVAANMRSPIGMTTDSRDGFAQLFGAGHETVKVDRRHIANQPGLSIKYLHIARIPASQIYVFHDE